MKSLALAAAIVATAAAAQPAELFAPLDDIRFAAGTLADERVVKGAPYCADAVHENVQTLADGNRIVRGQGSRLCRDGEGRTRQEVERGGHKSVYLRDPVARENWVLDPQRKTARRLRSVGSMSFDFVEVQVIRLGDGDTPTALPPAVRWTAQMLAPRGPGVLTPLPAREIEGVRAHGERTTGTIEAGKVGNEKPIEIVREVWTAPELALTLSTRDFDPRSGEVNYRLANLKRGEPDPALMRVPVDSVKKD
jgi:hypothetical protein